MKILSMLRIANPVDPTMAHIATTLLITGGFGVLIGIFELILVFTDSGGDMIISASGKDNSNMLVMHALRQAAWIIAEGAFFYMIIHAIKQNSRILVICIGFCSFVRVSQLLLLDILAMYTLYLFKKGNWHINHAIIISHVMQVANNCVIVYYAKLAKEELDDHRNFCRVPFWSQSDGSEGRSPGRVMAFRSKDTEMAFL